jgi:hypothetical protein
MNDTKVFKLGYGIVTIDKLYFIPNCKDNTGNLWFIHFTYCGTVQFTGRILYRTKVPLNYNLSIVRGKIAHELKNLANI